MVELVRIHRDAKGTTRFLEPACERIRAMSARFDGNPDALVDDVHQRFAKKDPTLGLFVGLDGDDLVGHVLAFIQVWDGRYVAWIVQTENDGIANRTLVDRVLAVLTDWIEAFNFSFRANGITVTEMLFCTPHMNDAWARHSGFTDYRSIKRRAIPMVAK